METLLFLIIVGIMSAMFGKGKGTKQGAGRKPLTRSTFEEMKTLFQERIPEKIPSELKHIPKTIPQSAEKGFVKTIQVMNDQPAGRNSYKETIEKLDSRQKASDVKEVQDEAFITKEPDAKTILNGIIWSEILGEPRSKNPHFSRRR